MTDATIVSIQVGLPRLHPLPNPWESGIFKSQIEGEVWLGKTNLDGDGQSDLVHHGGEDRAVLAYSADHYPVWRSHLGLELPFGSFGENFTLTGLNEQSVCLGDRWVTDEIELEISQPRVPCFKLSRRVGVEDLNQQVMKNGKGGWYFRVMKEGNVKAGQVLRLAQRPFPDWPTARAYRIYLTERDDTDLIQELHDLPCLSQLWKSGLNKRVSD